MTKHVISTTKNVERDKIIAIVGAYIQGKMRMFTSIDKVQKAVENELRYPMEMMSTLRYRSTLKDHILSLKKEYIFILLHNLEPKYGQGNRMRCLVKNMTNNVSFVWNANGMYEGAAPTISRISC